MKEQFVPYELALKLKELGFKEKCLATIDQSGYLHIKGTKSSPRGSMLYDIVDCPTLSQAFRWFREEHDLHYQLVPFFSDKESHAVDYYLAIAQHRPPIQVNTFEEAELACLEKLIEILETKQQEQ
jgi:hypothetical protein